MQTFTILRQALALTLLMIASGLSAQTCENFNGDMEILNDPATNFPAGYYDYSDGTITSSVVMPGLSGSGTAAESTQSGGGFAGYAIGVSNITAGQDYTFTAEVEVTSATIDFANIYISWRDAAGAEQATSFSGNANPGDGVVTLSVTGTAPANVTQLQFAINFKNGTVVMDNFCVAAADPGSFDDVDGCDGNLLANGTLNGSAAEFFDYAQGASVFTYNTGGGVDATGAGELTPAAGQSFYGFGQRVPATVGETYRARVQAAQTATAGYANLVLEFQDDNGSPVEGFQVPIDGPLFETYEVTGTCPAGATQVQVVIGAGQGAGVVADNFCLLPGAFVGAAQDEPNNLVFDGTFENSTEWFEEQTEGWTCFGCGGTIRNVMDPSTGSTAVRIAGGSPGDPNGNGYNGLIFQYTQVDVGGTYAASADLKRLGTSIYGQLHLYFRDANGNTLADFVAQANNDGAYENYMVAGVAPANTAVVLVALEMGNSGFLLADNVVLTEEASMPVVLSAFDGEVMNKYNAIRWATSSEDNTQGFSVERSLNGHTSWETVAEAAPRGGLQVAANYEVRDERPLAEAFYRLHTRDFDGMEQFSDVIRLVRTDGASVAVYPNPFGNQLTVRTSLAEAGEFILTDALGRTLRKGSVAAGAQITNINTTDLSAGRYVLRVGEEVISVIR